MNNLLPRLERWNEEDKYQEIIDAIEALPEGELNFTLISALARAYNNLAIDVMPPEDRPLYQRALDLLLPLEDQLEAAVKERLRGKTPEGLGGAATAENALKDQIAQNIRGGLN